MIDFQDTQFVDYRMTAAQPFCLYRSAVPAAVRHDAALPDAHYASHLGILLAGTMELEWPDYSAILQPGNCWLTAAWEPHWGRRGATANRLVLVTLQPDWLDGADLARLFRVTPPQRPWGRSASVRREMRRLGEALWIAGATLPEAPYLPRVATPPTRGSVTPGGGNGPAPEGAALRMEPTVAAVWMLVHAILFRLHAEEPPPAVPATAGGATIDERRRIQPAVDLVRWRAGAAVRVDDAALVCGLGRSRFAELFQRVMGVSFGRFETDARLAGAATALRRAQDPVKAVAAAWGFYDVSHFHHVFARRFGHTPAAYRAAAQQER